MSIEFTQYLRPDGRKEKITIDRPEHVELIAREFIKAGGRFEAEVLSTGEVSLTAHYDDEDVAIEICANGPAVEPAVDRLVAKCLDAAARAMVKGTEE